MIRGKNELTSVRILVDVDARPKVINEMLYRAADQVDVPLTPVANHPVKVRGARYFRSMQSASGQVMGPLPSTRRSVFCQPII